MATQSVGIHRLLGNGDFHRPNVLFVSVDDWNDWARPSSPYSQLKTPHVDKLRSEGLFFRTLTVLRRSAIRQELPRCWVNIRIRPESTTTASGGDRRFPKPLPCLVISENKVILSQVGVRFFTTPPGSTTRRLTMTSFSGIRKPLSEVGLKIFIIQDGQVSHLSRYPKCSRLRRGILIMCRLMSGMRIHRMGEWRHGAPTSCSAGITVPFFYVLECFGRILSGTHLKSILIFILSSP